VLINMELSSMDFGSLFRSNVTQASRNMTSNKTFHDGMMESLLPFVGGQFTPILKSAMFIYDIVGSHLGFDPTIILTLVGFVWAMNRVGKQVYTSIYGIIQENFMSTVHISSTDEIYNHLMRWLAMQPLMTNSRSLTAETVSKTAWEEEEELQALQATTTTEGGLYLNFSNQEAKAV
jgi:mitochondrial chaperone BCS1